MGSLRVLETEDILNISSDFESSPASEHASKRTAVSPEHATMVIEDSLKDLPPAPLRRKLSIAKRTKPSKDMFNLSSSPGSDCSVKRKTVNDDALSSSQPKKKSKPSKPEATSDAAQDEDDESSEQQEESDEYQPTQPKKTTTLGSKLANASTRGKLKSVRAVAAGTKPATKTSKKDTSKATKASTAQQPKQGAKSAKQVVKDVEKKASSTKTTNKQKLAHESDELDDQDHDDAKTSRKDRMQTSSKTTSTKTTTSKPRTTKDSKKSTKTSKSTAHSAAPEPSNGVGQNSLDPLQGDQPDKPMMPLVDDRPSKSATIVSFGKGVRKSEPTPTPDVRVVAKELAVSHQKRKRETVATTNSRDTRGKNRIDDTNIAEEDEDPLAGFGVTRSDKLAEQVQSPDVPIRADAKQQKQKAVDDAAMPKHSGSLRPQLRASQLAMPPPPKHAKKPTSVGIDILQDSDSTNDRRSEDRRSRAKTPAKSPSNGNVQTGKAYHTLSSVTKKAPPSGQRDIDDSGYQSGNTGSRPKIEVARMHSDHTKTPAKENAEDVDTSSVEGTGGSTHKKKRSLGDLIRDQDTSDEEAAVLVPRKGKAKRVKADIPVVDEALEPERARTDNANTAPLSDHAAAKDISEQPKGVAPAPRRSVDEIFDWRSTLRAHQRELFDQLVNDAETLVSYLVHREKVITDVIHDYREQSQDLVKRMEIRHAKEYQQYCADRDARVSQILN